MPVMDPTPCLLAPSMDLVYLYGPPVWRRHYPHAKVANQSSSKGLDFLDRITKSIDPDHQVRRDSDRASAIFQAQQSLLLQSQIRDLNQTVQSLRTQLNDSERRRAASERRADRLQNQIDITSAVTRAQLYRSTEVPALSNSRQNPISVSSSSSPCFDPRT
jgi:TolA-binding protein